METGRISEPGAAGPLLSVSFSANGSPIRMIARRSLRPNVSDAARFRRICQMNACSPRARPSNFDEMRSTHFSRKTADGLSPSGEGASPATNPPPFSPNARRCNSDRPGRPKELCIEFAPRADHVGAVDQPAHDARNSCPIYRRFLLAAPVGPAPKRSNLSFENTSLRNTLQCSPESAPYSLARRRRFGARPPPDACARRAASSARDAQRRNSSSSS